MPNVKLTPAQLDIVKKMAGGERLYKVFSPKSTRGYRFYISNGITEKWVILKTAWALIEIEAIIPILPRVEYGATEHALTDLGRELAKEGENG